MKNRNKRVRKIKRGSDPTRQDPTRTATLRAKFVAEINRRFSQLARDVIRLVDEEDSLGLKETSHDPFTANALRIEMPQIRKEHWEDFLKFAKSKSSVTEEQNVDPSDLRAVQSEFSQERVDAIPLEKLQWPILISKDGYVLDGNHRWIKALQTKTPMKVLRMGLKVDAALDLMKSFDKVQFVGNEDRDNCGTGSGGFQRGNTCAAGTSVDSPEFRRWFGNSKTVDRDGNPKRLYHGTTKEFDSFDPDKGLTIIDRLGTWLADAPNLAEERLRSWEKADVWGSSTGRMPNRSRTLAVYAAIENPKVFRKRADLDTYVEENLHLPHDLLKQAVSYFEEHYRGRRSEHVNGTMRDLRNYYADKRARANVNSDALTGESWGMSDSLMNKIRDHARQLVVQHVFQGHDGIKIEDDQGHGAAWVAFRPSQVKSALSNRGTYSRDSNRIDNFNPYHDPLGRFASKDESGWGIGGATHRSYPYREVQSMYGLTDRDLPDGPLTLAFRGGDGTDGDPYLVSAEDPSGRTFAFLAVTKDDDPGGGFIRDVKVHGPLRGQGLGSSLYRDAMRELARHTDLRWVRESARKKHEAPDRIWAGLERDGLATRMDLDGEEVRRVDLDRLVENANPKGCNQYTGPGCDGDPGVADRPARRINRPNWRDERTFTPSREQVEQFNEGVWDAAKKIAKRTGASISHAEHAFAEWAKHEVALQVMRLPTPIQTAVTATYFLTRMGTKAAFATWMAGQAFAERVAREQGLTDEEAATLRSVLATRDIVALKPVQVGIVSSGYGEYAAPLSMIPPATAEYLLRSTIKNPMAVARAAGKLVKGAIKKLMPEGKPKNRYTPQVTEITRNASQEQDFYLLADALKAHGYDDWYQALLAAAMDELGVEDGVDLADELWKAQPTSPVVNRFCPTGPGGGIDPTCTKDESGWGGSSEKVKFADAPGSSGVAKLVVGDKLVEVYRDPTEAGLKTWLKKLPRYDAEQVGLRAILSDGHLYAWEWSEAEHHEVTSRLGVKDNFSNHVAITLRRDGRPVLGTYMGKSEAPDVVRYAKKNGFIVNANPYHDELGRFTSPPAGYVDLYHGTKHDKADKIEQEGVLKAPAGGDIYLTKNPEYAKMYGPRVFRVRVKESDVERVDFESGDGDMDQEDQEQIEYAAEYTHRHKVVPIHSRVFNAEDKPNCGTGAGGFQPGNSCATGKTGGESTSERSDSEHENSVHHLGVKSLAQSLKEDWRYHGKVNVYDQEGRVFEVGGQKWREAGNCVLSDGTVTIHSRSVGSEIGDVRRICAHEMMHGIFERVWRRSEEERRKAGEEKADTRSGRKLRMDDGLYPQFAEEFPTFARLQPFFYGMLSGGPRRLREDDGITPYSKAYWADQEDRKVSTHLAVHETLAEIAALHESTGVIHGSKTYRQLYKLVREEYRVLEGHQRTRRMKVPNMTVNSETHVMYVDAHFVPTTPDDAVYISIWKDGRHTWARREDIPQEQVRNADWRFQPNPEKVRQFQEWLRNRVDQTLRSQGDRRLWEQYAQEGFRKGQARAYDDYMRRDRDRARSREDYSFYQGGREQFLKSSFHNPVAVETVQLLAGRSFDELKNVTADMSNRMSRVLTDGLVQGQSPVDIAKKLVEEVNLSKARAELVARTEIVRAHSEGQLHALEAMGADEVGIMVEWSVSGVGKTKKGYPSPCPKCAALKGIVLKVSEAHGLIPRHPRCMCAFVPAPTVMGKQPGQKTTKAQIEAAISKSRSEGEDWGSDLEISSDRGPTTNRIARYLVNADEENCGTGAGGFKPGNTCAAGKEKFVGQIVSKREHVRAGEIEHEVADGIGAKVVSLEDGVYTPRDATYRGHQLEIKSLLKGSKQAISVHPDALYRKVMFMQDNPTARGYHTIVVDDRNDYEGGAHSENYSGHRLYYKRGSGRYSLASMHRVRYMAELRRLILTDDADLPEKAYGTLPSSRTEIETLREKAERAHESRLAKDRARKQRMRRRGWPPTGSARPVREEG